MAAWRQATRTGEELRVFTAESRDGKRHILPYRILRPWLLPRCKVLPPLPDPARDLRPLVSGLLCRGLFIGLQAGSMTARLLDNLVAGAPRSVHGLDRGCLLGGRARRVAGDAVAPG